MGRPLRVKYAGAFYHITSLGNERKKIFLDDGDGKKFLEILDKLQSDFFIPYQSDWREKVDPLRTPQNNPDILKAPTIYEIINEIPGVGSYFSERGGDPVVVANSHYARGAYWLTWDIEFRWGEAEVMDQVSWDKLDDYLNGKYKSGILGLGGRNKVPFSALTVWYLPGLDHKAHFKGMGEYRNYFITNTDDYIKKVVKTLKDLGEFDNKIFIIVESRRCQAEGVRS